MATTTLRVEGMTCGACTSSVEAAFQDISAVESVSVSLMMGRAVIQHDPSLFPPEKIQELIENRGFDAQILTTEVKAGAVKNAVLFEDEVDVPESRPFLTTILSVAGMTCGACTSALEGCFKNNPAVKSITVSLLSERAVVEHDGRLLAPDKLAEAIEDAGFDASVISSAETHHTSSGHMSRQMEDREYRAFATTIAVQGMTCGACTSAVEAGFSNRDGILHFNISLLAERAVVRHDARKISAHQIAEIIQDRGFGATVVSSEQLTQLSSASSTVHMDIYGLQASQSTHTLESELLSLTGVSSVSIDGSKARATIVHVPTVIGLRTIVDLIEKAGYNVLITDADDTNAQLESLSKTKEIQEWRRAFHTSLAYAIPVFLISMIFPLFVPFLDFGSMSLGYGLWLGDVICLFLTIPVQFGIGRRFYRSAWKSLRHGSPTMDVLVALGTSAAFFFSVAAMAVSIFFSPHNRPSTVFDTSSMLITFVCMGRYLENKAKGQASKALTSLMSLAPSMTTIYIDPIAAAKAAASWDSEDEKLGIPRKSMSIPTEEKTIPTELLQIGDIVVLKPGDKIPADGTVIYGESYVNESMITGEAMPILKKKHSSLMAGTINGVGRLDLLVTTAGRDTQLSQIVRLVQQAQTTKATIQRIADIVAGYFVSIIITLGLTTFVAWLILSHVLAHPPSIFNEPSSGGKVMVCVKLCISVIVFACPCALGLATPTAVMVGTGVGAQQGILIKGGAVLEIATKVNHVVFDKTGTLTTGMMTVSRHVISPHWSMDEQTKLLWWTLIGLVEMGSEHPIAKAIVVKAKQQLGLSTDSGLDGSAGDFKAVAGKGVVAHCEAAIAPERRRYRLIIGNLAHLRSEDVNIPESVRIEEEDEEGVLTPRSSSNFSDTLSAGNTIIHLAIDQLYAGSITLCDAIKPGARATILALQRLGISSSIVTGDTRIPASIVARQLAISPDNVHASCTPADKKQIIEVMQQPIHQGGKGLVVAMVGDGINDSPALATATVGIALSSGTDVAMEAASIVLTNPGDLVAVPAALHLSRYIFGRIKLNLLWACGYNLIGLPFAMGLFLPWGYSLPPMAAGAAMALSSVSVVSSSVALKWWRKPRWMSIKNLDPANAPEGEDYTQPGMWTAVYGWLTGWFVWAPGRRLWSKSGPAYVQLEDLEPA